MPLVIIVCLLSCLEPPRLLPEDAEPCHPVLVSRYNDSAPSPTGIDIAGENLYVSDRHAGLLVYTLSNSDAPRLVASVPTPSEALRVAVDGHRAYVQVLEGGIAVFDVSTPESPKLVHQHEYPHTVHQLLVGDDTLAALITDPSETDVGRQIDILDVSDDEEFLPLATIDLPGSHQAIALRFDALYAIDGTPGLLVYDVDEIGGEEPGTRIYASSIQEPLLLSQYGPRLFVVSSASGGYFLHAYGLSVPTNPQPSSEGPIFASGSLVALAGENAQVVLVDRHYDGDVLRIVSTTELCDIPIGEMKTLQTLLPDIVLETKEVRHIALRKGILYSIIDDRLFAVDLLQGIALASIWQSQDWSIRSGERIKVHGDHAAVLHDSGIEILLLDINDPEQPMVRWFYRSQYEIDRFAYLPPRLYTLEEKLGLHILDISTPGSPQSLGNFSIPGSYQALIVEGQEAAVLTGGWGDLPWVVHLLDISDPLEPVHIAQISGDQEVESFHRHGSHLLLSGGSRIIVIDVSNPLEPVITDEYNPNAPYFFRTGPIASSGPDLIAASSQGIVRLALSDDGTLSSLHKYAVGWRWDDDVLGFLDPLLLICGEDRCGLLDTRQEEPVPFVGLIETPYFADLGVSDTHFLILDWKEGLSLWDVDSCR